jgi:glycosidase
LFFAGLNALKKQHPALWNGTSGGAVQLLEVGNDKLFAFKRQQGKDHVRVIVNRPASCRSTNWPATKARLSSSRGAGASSSPNNRHSRAGGSP